jgi:type I restriction enzyme S subunit
MMQASGALTALKRYPAYKDSGVPWLGNVPQHWQVRRLKTLCSQSALYGANVAATTYTPTGVRFLRTTDITEDGQLKSGGVFLPEELVRDYLLTDGDVLLSRSGTIGRSLLYNAKLHGPCAYAGYLVRFVPGSAVLPRYLFLYTKTQAFAAFLRVMAISSTIENVNGEKYANAVLPLPSVVEQGAIVRFLDYARRRIRRYIGVKQELIKLLEEEKQAIIHRAVTRGVDPAVPLKPSGVDWLGRVPKHWEVLQLRRLVRRGRRITYGIVQPGEPDASGRFMVRGQDYSFGWARPEAVFRVSHTIEAPYKRSRLASGDLVLTIVGAGVGNVAIVPSWLDGANITQTTARISVDPAKGRADFIAAVLQGPVGERNVELYVKGAAQPGLNLEHVRLFVVPVPPIEEQRRIVAVIRRDTGPLQTAVDHARREIALLLEYRTRLTSDVVTGKLDVREAAAKLPDQAEEPEELPVTEEALREATGDDKVAAEEMVGEEVPA